MPFAALCGVILTREEEGTGEGGIVKLAFQCMQDAFEYTQLYCTVHSEQWRNYNF